MAIYSAIADSVTALFIVYSGCSSIFIHHRSRSIFLIVFRADSLGKATYNTGQASRRHRFWRKLKCPLLQQTNERLLIATTAQ